MSEIKTVIGETDEAPKASKPVKLKGNPSWRPASEELIGKAKGFGYRKVRFDQIGKKLSEGWQLIEAKDGEHTAVDGGNRVFGGKRIDGLLGGVGFIYMRLADDGVEARNEYYNQRAERQIRSIESDAQKQTGLITHGDVKIDNRGDPVKQVIE